MIWLLLWTAYATVGFALLPRLLRRRLKIEQAKWSYISIDMGDPDVWIPALMQITVWPAMLPFLHNERKAEAVKETEREEREHEALLESIRRERYAPDPRLAEFDKELGIEPEHNEDPELWVEPKQWRAGNPEAAAEYDANMEIARLKARLQDTSWEREVVECNVRQGYAMGGYIPTTAELNPVTKGRFSL